MSGVCLCVLDTGGEADMSMADRDSDSGSEVGDEESDSDEQSDGDDLMEKRGLGSRLDERERDEERERGQEE